MCGICVKENHLPPPLHVLKDLSQRLRQKRGADASLRLSMAAQVRHMWLQCLT